MARAILRTRTLLLLLCIVLSSLGHVDARAGSHDGLVARHLHRRATPDALPLPSNSEGTAGAGTGTGTATGTTTSDTTTSTPTTTTTPTTTSTPPPITTPTTTSTPPPTSTPDKPTEPAAPTTPPTSADTSPPPTGTSTVTDSSNQSTATVLVGPSDTGSSSASPSPTQSNTSSSGGITTGTIIGLSVSGGIAVIGVIAFFVWKFTRKRSSEFDDEPIKWPELNSHGENLQYALPTKRAETGAGSGGGFDSTSEVDLPGRNPSATAYAQSIGADSTANLYAAGSDPYAVPPLPHVNPNAPYRDDPGAQVAAGYYDPYRGPVPQTFNDGASVDSHAHGPFAVGEAIPMSTLAGGAVNAGRRSPGPQVAYDGSMAAGRRSPGPQMAYGDVGRSATMTGRQSPSPNVAYNPQQQTYTGRMSPGPNAAYTYGGL